MQDLRLFGVLALALALSACLGGGDGGCSGTKKSGGGGGGGAAQTPSEPTVPPEKPAAVAAFPGDSKVGLTWLASDSGGKPTAFKIYRDTTPGFTPIGPPLYTAAAAESSFVDSGVTNFTLYYYVVVANNDAGDSVPSDPVSATPMAGLPGTPEHLTASATDGRVTLAWDPPSEGGEPSEYRIYRGSQQAFTLSGALLDAVTPESTVYADDAVENFTTYYYVVTAVNATGEGMPSEFKSAQPNNGPPVAPLLDAPSTASRQVTLKWTPPSSGGSVYGYRVYCSPTGSGAPCGTPEASVSSSTDTYTFTNLTDYEFYQFAVAAWNPLGQEATSSVEAMPGLVPSTLANVTITAGNTTISLKWDGPADSIPVTRYRIYKDTAPNVSTTGNVYDATEETSFSYNSLVNGTAYFYRVVPENLKGVGPSSMELVGYPRQPNSEVISGDPNPLPGQTNHLGRAVALSGNYAVIGAPGHTSLLNGAAQAGAAYIYERAPNGQWAFKSFLEEAHADPVAEAQFGHAVAIDGDVAVVGAPRQRSEDNPTQLPGRVNIFRRNAGGTWNLDAALEPPAGNSGALFGFSVAVSGNRVLVGAPGRGSSPCGASSAANTGLVYRYEYSGSAWTRLDPEIRPPDGNCTISAYASMGFGTSVAMSGNLAVVGAPHEGSTSKDLGAAYFFLRDTGTGPGQGNWSYITNSKYVDPISTGSTKHVGTSVAIAGNWAAVGETEYDCPAGVCNPGSIAANIGAVVFFEYVAPSWVNPEVVRHPSATEGGSFGMSLSMTQDRAVVTAKASTSSGPFQAFHCPRSGSAWSCNGTPAVTAGGVGQAAITVVGISGSMYSIGLTAAADQDNILLGMPFADDPSPPASGYNGDFAFY